MLKPIKPTDDCSAEFVACDIENFSNGDVIVIDTCWRERGELTHFECPNWLLWWEWLTSKAESDPKFRRVYAHNGGGWDWLSFIGWLLDDGRQNNHYVSASYSGSKMIVCTITIQGDGDTPTYSIVLADSLQLLRSSLAKLSAKFLPQGEAKIDLDGKMPEDLYKSNKRKFREYYRRDTESLVRILEMTLEMVREKIAKVDDLGVTIGSTAMNIFRTGFLDREISIPFDPIVKRFLRKAYTGGRVEVFRYGHFPDVNVFDVNSLYPYAMKTCSVPTTGSVLETDEIGECGVYEIIFEQRDKSIPAVLLDNNHSVYSGHGFYFAPELNLLREVDPKCKIKMIRGYEFAEHDYIFAGFVDSVYALRLADRNSPVSELAKFILNSSYGKWGQHSIREEIMVADHELLAIWLKQDEHKERLSVEEENKLKQTPYRLLHGLVEAPTMHCDDPDIWRVKKETNCSYEHVGIAGMITSRARVILYQGLLAAGKERIYCDTDSVHMVGSLPSDMVGVNLGQYKLEASGEGVYAGRKLYALRNAKGEEKVRCKGVSVKSATNRNGFTLDFNDILSLTKGKEITTRFLSPTSALKVFAGAKPCVFESRKRKIRKV